MWRCTRPTGNCRPAFAEREVAFFLEPPRPPLTILNLRSGLVATFPPRRAAGGARIGWQLRAPRPRRPPPTAPQHALSVAAAAIVGASMVCIAITTMHTMNNTRRAPRAHASLQPRRHREPPRVRSPREEGQERRARESIVVIERCGGVGTARTRARCTDWVTSSRARARALPRRAQAWKPSTLSSRECCALTIT